MLFAPKPLLSIRLFCKMNKRKAGNFDETESRSFKKTKEVENVKKHSLDSDEEDDDSTYDASNLLDEDDIEGEEDGVPHNNDGVRTTAFNMREELEEGYFDKDGHFLWKKDKDIRDNWLDNIDWHEIKPRDVKSKELKSLGDESDSEDEDDKKFDEIANYKQILEFLQPKENTSTALRRLAGGKLSSKERLKRKKEGTLDENEDKIIKLTELANNILNQTGNMDIYQETYEHITQKIKLSETTSLKNTDASLNMYSDDFDSKEKQKIHDPGPSSATDAKSELMWEFKWTQDTDEIEGPKTTAQMQQFVDEGKFKKGVWVRKTGQEQFYSSSRIDFELYLS